MKTADNKYIPFGEAWERECMKLNKKTLIDLIRKNGKKCDELESVISQFHPSPKEISEEEIGFAFYKYFEERKKLAPGWMFTEKEELYIKQGYFQGFKKALSLPSSGSKTEAVEFAEWIRLRFQNTPLEFDNYWEDYKGFPNNTGKCYTTVELFELFLKDKQQ